MICLLLIMTMVFINGTDGADQKIRHLDTLLNEEEMNAKTKAWLLMVESGKVDQDELRRITPKSIFIAPLLSNGPAKCKEGYRHDHLGQCVKVIKIDPKAQLELLLQRLNKLYADKNDDKDKDVFHPSTGPLQFSLPISTAEDKTNASQNAAETDPQAFNSTVITTTTSKTPPEFIPIPLALVFSNRTDDDHQTDEMESSGAGPINDTALLETSHHLVEGSGAAASGDEPLEEPDEGGETTTGSPVSILPDEVDYVDVKEAESTAVPEVESTTVPPEEIPTAATAEENTTESYKNGNDGESPEEIVPATKELFPKNNQNSGRIVFPDEETLRTRVSSSGAGSSRIRFPDEVAQLKASGYETDADYKFDRYQIHSSVIPREQFWWLPKNWQIDDNQQKSPLVKVWSRLPLIHDITYSHPTAAVAAVADGFETSFPPERPHQQAPHGADPFAPGGVDYQHRSPDHRSPDHRSPSGRSPTRFKVSRFQDMVQTQRQNFRLLS